MPKIINAFRENNHGNFEDINSKNEDNGETQVFNPYKHGILTPLKHGIFVPSK
jgi:hypothetical protein